MKKFPLDLNSLAPKEMTFTLSGAPNTTLTLCRFSLRVRSWAFEKYGPEKLKLIFERVQILEIAELAYFMLKEKDVIKSQNDFLDAIVTVPDQINLVKALLGAVGIGEPEIEQINATLKPPEETPGPNAASPKDP